MRNLKKLNFKSFFKDIFLILNYINNKQAKGSLNLIFLMFIFKNVIGMKIKICLV